MDNSYKRENRIAEALSLRGMKQVELCEKTGLKKASVNGWIKQNWQPKQDSLYKMAKALDVSEMWLAGYDVPMERTREQSKVDELTVLINEMQNNDRVKNLFINISRLSSDQFNTIESMVNELTKINGIKIN